MNLKGDVGNAARILEFFVDATLTFNGMGQQLPSVIAAMTTLTRAASNHLNVDPPPLSDEHEDIASELVKKALTKIITDTALFLQKPQSLNDLHTYSFQLNVLRGAIDLVSGERVNDKDVISTLLDFQKIIDQEIIRLTEVKDNKPGGGSAVKEEQVPIFAELSEDLLASLEAKNNIRFPKKLDSTLPDYNNQFTAVLLQRAAVKLFDAYELDENDDHYGEGNVKIRLALINAKIESRGSLAVYLRKKIADKPEMLYQLAYSINIMHESNNHIFDALEFDFTPPPAPPNIFVQAGRAIAGIIVAIAGVLSNAIASIKSFVSGDLPPLTHKVTPASVIEPANTSPMGEGELDLEAEKQKITDDFLEFKKLPDSMLKAFEDAHPETVRDVIERASEEEKQIIQALKLSSEILDKKVTDLIDAGGGYDRHNITLGAEPDYVANKIWVRLKGLKCFDAFTQYSRLHMNIEMLNGQVCAIAKINSDNANMLNDPDTGYADQIKTQSKTIQRICKAMTPGPEGEYNAADYQTVVNINPGFINRAKEKMLSIKKGPEKHPEGGLDDGRPDPRPKTPKN